MNSVQSPILKLSNEILSHIFTYVRENRPRPLPYGELRDCDNGLEDTKNARLVCRRFCGASSHLLINTVSVSMASSSLTRLDHISCHPLIAKGVRKVRVVLDFFASEVEEDFNQFLFNQHQQMYHIIPWDYRTDGLRTLSREDADLEAAAKKKIRKFLSTWNKLELINQNNIPNNEDSTSEVGLDDEDRANTLLIGRSYELYRHAYLEQERVRTDGSFVRKIACMIAKMPVARSLCIMDSGMDARPQAVSIARLMNSPNLLIEKFARPMTWIDSQELGIGTQPIELLSQIPLAIHKAGVMLTDVNYQITPVENFSRLFTCDDDLSGLRDAMRQLTDFTFSPGIVPYFAAFINGAEMSYFKKFVEAFTDTDSLQGIAIHVVLSGWDGTITTLTTGSLLSTRTWSQLRRASFGGPLQFEELEKFYAKTQGLVDISLKGVYLASGSWADVLDIMRANSQRGFIYGPSGAECDTVSEEQDISEEQENTVNTVFEGFPSSMAQLYIRNKIPHNPLRALEEMGNQGVA